MKLKNKKRIKLIPSLMAFILAVSLILSALAVSFAEDAGLTTEEKSWVTQHRSITVGYMNNYLPFSATSDNGAPTGIVKDYVPLLLENIGLPNAIGVVYAGYNANEAMYDALHRGEIDIAFPVFGDDEYAAEKQVLFSESIISISIDLAYQGTYNEETTEKIAVNNNNQLQEYYTRHYYPDSEIVYFDTIDDCLRAVQSGKVGTTFLNGLRTSALLGGSYAGKLKAARLPNGVEFGFAVDPKDAVLLSIIDKAIEKTDAAAAFTYSFSYVDSVVPYTAEDFIRDNIVLVALIAAAFFILIFILVYRRIKNRELKGLNNQLREYNQIIEEQSKREIEQAEQARKDQIAKMAGGVSAYIVEPATGRFQIIKQNEYLSGNYTADEDFWTSISRYIENDIFEHDRKHAREALTIPAILDALETEDEYTVRFRDISGLYPHWYEMRAVRLSDSEILMGFADKDDEIIGQMLYGKMQDNYFGLYYVNFDSGVAQVVKTGHPEITGKAGTAIHYPELMEKIASASEGETRDFLKRISSIDFLRKGFAVEDTGFHVYKSYIFEGNKWVNITGIVLSRHEDGTPAVLALGFSLLDEDASRHQEAQLKLRESMAVVGGLAEEYVALYCLDVNTGHYEVYRATEKISDTEANFSRFPKLVDLFHNLIESDAVHPDYKQQLRDFYPSDEAIELALRDNSRISTLFLRNYSGEYLWTEISAIRCEGEGNSHNIIFAVSEVDQEIREREARFKAEEEASKLVSGIIEQYSVAFTVNMENDAFRLLKVDKRIRGKFDAFSNYFEAKASLYKILHSMDRERIMHELEYASIRERIKENSSYTLEYRTAIAGVTKWHEMNITAVGENEVAMGFTEKDLEITKRLLEDRRFNESFALFVVDIDTEMIKIVKNDEHYQTIPVGCSVPYTEYIRGMAESLEGEPRIFYSRMADLEFVKKELAADDKRSYSYKSNYLRTESVWVDVTSYVILRHDDGTPAMFTFGFSVSDARAAESNELQSRLKENMQLIGGLADGYDALYYINIDEHVFSIYTLNEEKYPGSRAVVEGRTDFYDAIKSYGQSELVHPDDRILFADFDGGSIRRKLSGNKKYSINFRIKTEDGYRWNQMEVVKYEDAGETANAVAVGFSDRDAQIRTEQEYQRQLEDARRAAESANKSKTSFLFNMSHDIRTPMNAITGFTAMAKKHIEDEEKVSDYLEKIDTSGQQLLTLVNQVLEMARIESGKIELEEDPVNVRDEYDAAVTVLSEQAKANGLEFHHSLSDVTHYNIFADQARMNSITLNITGNAMKYTPRGGSVFYGLKEIAARKEGCATFVFTVEDTGIGMSEDYQKVLFDPFTRERNTTVSKIQGTGLGMSIVKELVDLLDGDIEVNSELGKGTRFDVTVDFKVNEAAEPETDAAEEAKVQFAGSRVLLVEDNELNREIALEILEEEGLIPECADDGTVAVDMMKEKGPEYYDFILMDIQMPVMDGYEATKAIREMYPDRHIPIIALSANAFAEDKAKSLAAGMDDHVAKPVNVKELFSALKKCL